MYLETLNSIVGVLGIQSLTKSKYFRGRKCSYRIMNKKQMNTLVSVVCV